MKRLIAIKCWQRQILQRGSTAASVSTAATQATSFKRTGATTRLFASNSAHSSFNVWEWSNRALRSAAPSQKLDLTFQAHGLWMGATEDQQSTYLAPRPEIVAPSMPARPEEPKCVPSIHLPSYKVAGVSLVVYLLHSLAHIELNAVDMCWDMILRFQDAKMPINYYTDWIKVANDEARHFQALDTRLHELGSRYGALLAHDSLWQSATRTQHDLKARIAVMQLVQEARALDSQERLVQKVGSSGDQKTVEMITQICNEEEDHVKKGMHWFNFLCDRDNMDPVSTFHKLVKEHVPSPLPPPFNHLSRSRAGFTEEWYMPLSRKVVSRKDTT